MENKEKEIKQTITYDKEDVEKIKQIEEKYNK